MTPAYSAAQFGARTGPQSGTSSGSQPGPQSGQHSTSSAGSLTSWFGRTERWLDDRGKGAWIAALVLGFIFIWPVGLALLAYIIWSKRMFSRHSCSKGREFSQHWDQMKSHGRGQFHMMRSSGNAAFDAYRAETIRRLEEEQEAFESFLQRLRDAKDKSEFDNFMDDRARANRETPAAAPDATPTPPPAAPMGGAY